MIKKLMVVSDGRVARLTKKRDPLWDVIGWGVITAGQGWDLIYIASSPKRADEGYVDALRTRLNPGGTLVDARRG